MIFLNLQSENCSLRIMLYALQLFSNLLFQDGASFVNLFFYYLCLSLPLCHVCFLQPCGHLVGKS